MEMVCLFGFLLPLHELHFGGARGRAERESGALGKNESDRGRGEGKGREGRNVKGGGRRLCSHLPLCQQLVTVATSKKSLSLIYTVAGSGVFNCIISFFLPAVTHPSLAAVLCFILGLLVFFFSPPVSSFLLLCCVAFFQAIKGVCVSQALVSVCKVTLHFGRAVRCHCAFQMARSSIDG